MSAEQMGVLRTVRLGQRELVYRLERKSVKNINLRVHRDGTVVASASRRVTAEQVDGFVTEKADFVLHHLAQFAAQEGKRPEPLKLVTGESIWLLGRPCLLTVVQGPKGGVDLDERGLTLTAREPDNYRQKLRILAKFWDRLCMEVFRETLDRLFPRLEAYHAARPSLRIRNMTSRWGSCFSLRADICLNKRLLQAPQSCIDYVAMHELCHLVHPDHSARFYGLLDRTMPGWQTQRAILKENVSIWI